MGYNLIIGEAKVNWEPYYISITCDVIRRDDAPAYDEPTDYENQRWPSYSSWGNFCRNLDIEDMMFKQDWHEEEIAPLISNHPGASPITKEHIEHLEKKLKEYKEKFPTHIAQYPPPKKGAKPLWEGSDMYKNEDLVEDPKYDGNLCRAEWLLYWLKWAVENCKKPVFVNS